MVLTFHLIGNLKNKTKMKVDIAPLGEKSIDRICVVKVNLQKS